MPNCVRRSELLKLADDMETMAKRLKLASDGDRLESHGLLHRSVSSICERANGLNQMLDEHALTVSTVHDEGEAS